MTEPEEALAQARESAAAMRAAGAYQENVEELKQAPDPVTTSKLLEWAMIEPDLGYVRSTRRWGAPITGFKRLLLRMLVQYHAELNAQQTRFNVGVLSEVARLKDRLDELERAEKLRETP